MNNTKAKQDAYNPVHTDCLNKGESIDIFISLLIRETLAKNETGTLVPKMCYDFYLCTREFKQALVEPIPGIKYDGLKQVEDHQIKIRFCPVCGKELIYQDYI
jgi:hypothetical protein